MIDPTGDISVIFPNQWTASEDVTRVPAGKSLKIPDPNKDKFSLVTQEPKGVAEVLIIASRSPLRKALQELRKYAQNRKGETVDGLITLIQPAEVVGSLLDDLNEGTRGQQGGTDGGGVRLVDTVQLAAMSITFEVI